MKWTNSLSSISAYKRCESHLTTKTTHGAIVTLLGVLLGVTLTLHELSWFLTGGGVAKTAVDLARRHDLGIHIDITFPAIPCAGLSMDVMDASGSTGNDVSRGKDVSLHKIRLDTRGKKFGGKEGEYHTPQSQKLVQDKQGTVMQIDLGAAMSQMGDMEREIQAHEGCRMVGDISVRRVAGKLHFAVHQQSFVDVLPQMLTGHVLPKLTNMSHIIHKVAFGPEFPGQANPLDGFRRVTQEGEALKAYKYFLKIVPTEYMSRMGFVLETNQYSVNEYALRLTGQRGPKAPNDTSTTVSEPFVDFSYDLSPIMMTVAQSPADLLHFIVRLCAVVGGVLSVTRMADKLVHSVLVALGVVVPPPSLKAKHRSSGGGGYGSNRNSYAGSGIDPLSGSLPGSGRSSYAGSAGMQADGTYHRSGGHVSVPGSHPLSTFSSNASSLVGMGSMGGNGMPPPISHAGSLGGSGGVSMVGNGTNGSMPGSAAGASYGGAAGGGGFPGGSQGGSPKAGFGSLGGFGPASSGPLYKTGSLSSLGTGGAGSRGVSSGGGGAAGTGVGGYSSDGGAARSGMVGAIQGRTSGGGSAAGGITGFGSAPLVGQTGSSSGGGGLPPQGLMNSVGSSRLSSASGPGSHTASLPGTQPLARGLSNMAPGSKQQ